MTKLLNQNRFTFAEKKKAIEVTYTQSFAAIIVRPKGQNSELHVKSQRWYQYQLNKFRNGENVTLAVHNQKPKRTEQQNRYYWGVYLPLIAEETGEKDLDRLHELFKGKFLTMGVVEVLGEKVRMKKSTTELGVGEFCQYIMDIEALTHIEAPPTENWDLVPLKEGIKKLSTKEGIVDDDRP